MEMEVRKNRDSALMKAHALIEMTEVAPGI
ncbi:hypothetical protein NNRS527_02723 [Nitrosospira sp. NRS527]|nr:hypothetical protein NNRS527_02723 [Nitrosospira sp. NRS527]